MLQIITWNKSLNGTIWAEASSSFPLILSHFATTMRTAEPGRKSNKKNQTKNPKEVYLTAEHHTRKWLNKDCPKFCIHFTLVTSLGCGHTSVK